MRQKSKSSDNAGDPALGDVAPSKRDNQKRGQLLDKISLFKIFSSPVN
jgi:hypothetical protein